MSIPTHRDSCITKAYPVACPDCKEDVWYFRCNCGSKVYFQKLGWPWDQHTCKDRLIREALELIKTSERLSDEEIYKRIEFFAKDRSWVIPQDILDLLDHELERRKTPTKYNPLRDLTGLSQISGMVVAINSEVSFIKRLNLDPNNKMHRGLAGDILSKSYAEIFIREQPNKNNVGREFIVFADKTYLRRNAIRISKAILANVIKIRTSYPDLWEINEHKCY